MADYSCLSNIISFAGKNMSANITNETSYRRKKRLTPLNTAPMSAGFFPSLSHDRNHLYALVHHTETDPFTQGAERQCHQSAASSHCGPRLAALQHGGIHAAHLLGSHVDDATQ